MPELPDVEAARRDLHRWLRGGVVTRAFDRRLAGRTVRAIERRGKWLRLELGDGLLVFSHLGMTGKWVRRAPGDPPERWERARIDVERRRGAPASARYVDARRLGRLVVARGDIRAWRELGPDLLVDGLDAPTLCAALSRRRRAVKEALMDQTLVAGVGNILATEALWLARLDPRSRTDALSRADVRAVARGLRVTIDRALARQPRGDRRYVNEGRVENPFRVYARAGTPCPRCGTTLRRIVLAGRGTVHCPRCQKRRG